MKEGKLLRPDLWEEVLPGFSHSAFHRTQMASISVSSGRRGMNQGWMGMGVGEK
jgi:hypothetical protein